MRQPHGGIGLATLGYLYLQLRRARSNYRFRAKCLMVKPCHFRPGSQFQEALCIPCNEARTLHAIKMRITKRLSSAANNFELKQKRESKRRAKAQEEVRDSWQYQ